MYKFDYSTGSDEGGQPIIKTGVFKPSQSKRPNNLLVKKIDASPTSADIYSVFRGA